MRKRKYLIGAVGAVAVSVAVAGIASAGLLQNQTLSVQVTSGQQDSKVAGPLSTFTVNVDTAYADPNNPVNPNTPKATRTRVDFPKDWVFDTTGIGVCQPASLAGTTTAQALAAPGCAAAQVGAGTSRIAGPLPASSTPGGVVTAFNGPPSGGQPTILLHNRTGPPLNNTTVLTGVLVPTDAGSQYGRTLDVTVPILAGGFVITHFDTTIPQKQTVAAKKAKKKKGKVVKKAVPAKYYVAAACSTKTWNFQARSTYDNGSTTTATATSPCTQKKAKKKKKKKKKK